MSHKQPKRMRNQGIEVLDCYVRIYVENYAKSYASGLMVAIRVNTFLKFVPFNSLKFHIKFVKDV